MVSLADTLDEFFISERRSKRLSRLELVNHGFTEMPMMANNKQLQRA